jgi:hypothetical protein
MQRQFPFQPTRAAGSGTEHEMQFTAAPRMIFTWIVSGEPFFAESPFRLSTTVTSKV